jgi:hypothetical protein
MFLEQRLNSLRAIQEAMEDGNGNGEWEWEWEWHPSTALRSAQDTTARY